MKKKLSLFVILLCLMSFGCDNNQVDNNPPSSEPTEGEDLKLPDVQIELKPGEALFKNQYVERLELEGIVLKNLNIVRTINTDDYNFNFSVDYDENRLPLTLKIILSDGEQLQEIPVFIDINSYGTKYYSIPILKNYNKVKIVLE